MKKWIGVEVYELIVGGIHLFDTEEDADKWFKKYTGVDYPKTNEEWEALDEDYDQTKIFEIDVPGPLRKVDHLRDILESQLPSPTGDWPALKPITVEDERTQLTLRTRSLEVGFVFDITGQKFLGAYNWKE